MKLPKVEFPALIPDTIMTGKKEKGRPLHRLQVTFPVMINGELYEIPAGFIFDFASIPQFLWPFFLPSDPDYAAASLLHDWGYAAELWPRKYIDQLFLSGLLYSGVKPFKARLMYAAVRIGGGFTYKYHSIQRIRHIRMLMGLTEIVDLHSRPLWK